MIQALIGPIANLAGTWFQNKLEKTKAEGKAKVAEAKARATVAEKVASGKIEWEGKMADATNESWKDEFWSLIFGAILICCFLPWTQPYVKEGFVFLQESTPNWFSNMLYIIIGSSFGYRFGKQGLQMINKKR